MELIKPSVKVESVTFNALQLIEIAGRTCYKSEDKITNDSSLKFVEMILKRGHDSVLEHAVATMRFICDRGVTHEIVRHRLASYSQESTRYCNYGKIGVKFMVPSDFELNYIDKRLLEAIELHYNLCLTAGRTPQQARYFLPNGLKTEIVMTANFREWRHFFKLRTSSAAHPDMRFVAKMAYEQLKEHVKVIFDDLGGNK